jgi:hypothetical protein
MSDNTIPWGFNGYENNAWLEVKAAMLSGSKFVVINHEHHCSLIEICADTDEEKDRGIDQIISWAPDGKSARRLTLKEVDNRLKGVEP